MRRQLTAAALLSTSFFFLTGFGKPVHSKVITQSSAKGNTVDLEFKHDINDKERILISKDGKWKLELVNTQGLKLKTTDGKFITETFDEKLPGFKVQAELDGAATAGKVDFTMKAFVCEKDKTRCYPETHKGTLEWKKS